jgi:G3E family GTPase
MLHFPSPDIGLFGRRQRHARGHRIPVRIVTDAGAGDGDTAVVVDDFGADEALLPEVGCQCCTVRVELQRALRRRLAQREQQPFRRIAIETGDAIAPILRTFVSERALGSECYVEDASPLEGNRFVLSETAPLSWEAFSRFVATLTALRGADLLHAKGLVNIERCHGPVAVQLMGHLAARPVELQAWPEDKRASRLTFVTRGVPRDTVADLLAAIRLTDVR